jgi:membrane protease YdiL (CAAX protease family)
VSVPKLSVARVGEGQARIPLGIAALTWLVSWLGGNLLAGFVIGASGESTGQVDTPVWLTLVSAMSLWIPMLLALREVSIRYGLGNFREDYGFSFRLVDLVGIPIGIASQLALLRVLYLPLEEAWPDTFSEEKLEKTARTLTDSAHGLWVAVLAVVIVIGAPFVEELMFRGLLQGAFARRINDVLAMVVVAVWFAVIHFRPVEYPGLFAFGLVLGTCAMVTRRIGMSIAAHLAFNATGLVLVALHDPIGVT